MKKNKLLLILIPIIVILLVLGGTFAYLKLNNTPKKIFQMAISKTFNAIKEKQKDYNSAKERVELSANIESEDESIKQINDILQDSKIILESEADIKNMVINGNLEAIYNNENIINAGLYMQDKKIYIALGDWFSKYIEIPEENYDFSEFEEMFEEILTVDKTLLLETIKQELINVVAKQDFLQETVILNLDGKDAKVTKSSLTLNNEQAQNLIKELLTNLKNNVNFQNAFGAYKDEIIENINESIDNMVVENETADSTIKISIYTKGFINEFVGVDFIVYEGQEEKGGIAFVKKNKTSYEGYAYENNNEKREFILRIIGEENNGQGTITILIPNDEKEIEIICKHQKNNNQTSYEITSEIEEAKLKISGSVIKEGTKYSGNAIITIEEQEYGTLNLSCLYNTEYNAPIEKKDVSNSVTIDNMTEEEEQELVTNIQKSKLYTLINQTIQNQNSLLNYAIQARNEINNGKDTMVTRDKYKVSYAVPEKLKSSEFNTKSSKTFTDENNNIVNVFIEYAHASEYLDELSNDYIITSQYYQNQNITEKLEYEVNGKKFDYRGITYKDDYGDYTKICFVYELDSDFIYVVETTIENDSMSLEEINNFLNINVE